MEALRNRISKVYRHRRRWARQHDLTAWRIYDRDIPGHRYTIDWYAGHAVVTSYPSTHPAKTTPEPSPGDLEAAVAGALSIPETNVFIKSRSRGARRQQQYQRQSRLGVTVEVSEGDARFEVNLSDYSDTGLFLDHRRTRERVREEASGRRVLNLFCYTGSFSVLAGLGKAKTTTSVDLSNSYLEWTLRNLALNGLCHKHHETVRADALVWLEENRDRRYDLIVLDPPSFSVSKKMLSSFEVQRDQSDLLVKTLALLPEGGVLYFSTNYRGFELDVASLDAALKRRSDMTLPAIEELTPGSIPEDFRDRQVHRCFRLVGGKRRRS